MSAAGYNAMHGSKRFWKTSMTAPWDHTSLRNPQNPTWTLSCNLFFSSEFNSRTGIIIGCTCSPHIYSVNNVCYQILILQLYQLEWKSCYDRPCHFFYAINLGINFRQMVPCTSFIKLYAREWQAAMDFWGSTMMSIGSNPVEWSRLIWAFSAFPMTVFLKHSSGNEMVESSGLTTVIRNVFCARCMTLVTSVYRVLCSFKNTSPTSKISHFLFTIFPCMLSTGGPYMS